MPKHHVGFLEYLARPESNATLTVAGLCGYAPARFPVSGSSFSQSGAVCIGRKRVLSVRGTFLWYLKGINLGAACLSGADGVNGKIRKQTAWQYHRAFPCGCGGTGWLWCPGSKGLPGKRSRKRGGKGSPRASKNLEKARKNCWKPSRCTSRNPLHTAVAVGVGPKVCADQGNGNILIYRCCPDLHTACLMSVSRLLSCPW